jgi:bifunctional UDP-N-acetylglucosamine pyrophosphorylase/glucosamine-1-phosphate N-acetyltransferase
MTQSGFACLILAAGRGTRMRSRLPKVLHRVAGLPMVTHVVAAAEAAGAARIGVVVGPEMADVAAAVAPHGTAMQAAQRGTGDAVRAGLPLLAGFDGPVLVLFGDTPLVRPGTLGRLVETLESPEAPTVAVLGMRPDEPDAYGRLIVDESGALQAIVEAAEATPDQRAIGLCNGGLMAFDGARLAVLLAALTDTNAKGEFYLTDTVAIAHAHGWACAVAEADTDEILGVNTRVDLAAAEAAMQRRLRFAAMRGGATLVDPDTVWLAADTRLGQDVTIGPSVVFGPGVTVADGVAIGAFCHLEGVAIERGARIGPFARLRPGAVVGEDCHVGNFVEIKNARLGAGAKVNHLSYVGDAAVGARSNIGAGTITCNYDGHAKHHTEIGADVFVGSNTALVAPVTVGDEALIAAGSVITADVPAGAMAVARGRQATKPGRARSWRAAVAAKRQT